MRKIVFFCLFAAQVFASEDSTYNFKWLDPDKEVFVLQNRHYRKDGRIYADVGGGVTTSGAFVDSNHLEGRVGFFATEEWGAEVIYSAHSGKENDTAKSVRGTAAGAIPFRRIVQNYLGGMVLWSPFYTKINTFNKILYMDWIFGLGVAKVNEENNRNEMDTNGLDLTTTTGSHNGLLWNVGMQLYITQHWKTRINMTALNYKATSVNKNAQDESWYSNYDLTFLIGYMF